MPNNKWVWLAAGVLVGMFVVPRIQNVIAPR